jgi:MFS family permease
MWHLQTFAALRHREFRLLWAGQAATATATWMDQVARGWLMYELTNSPVQLGLVQGVQAIPILVLSPLAGSVADRYPRKQQVVVAQILTGVLYTVLALFIITGHIQPWHVYASAHPVGHGPWSATADQAGAARVAAGGRWGHRSRWYNWAWLPLAGPR